MIKTPFRYHSAATYFIVFLPFLIQGKDGRDGRDGRDGVKVGLKLRFFKFKEARKGFSLLYCLGSDGRLQRRMFNGVGKLYISLQLHCWAIF